MENVFNSNFTKKEIHSQNGYFYMQSLIKDEGLILNCHSVKVLLEKVDNIVHIQVFFITWLIQGLNVQNQE